MPASVDQTVQACIATGEYRGALDLLAHTYLETVYRYCFRMLNGDAGHARDVTQQVFEEVCRGIVAYRGDASAKTWLLGIARNQCLKEIDVRARHRSMLRGNLEHVAMQAHTAPTLGSEAAMLSHEWLTRLQWALDQLESEERSLLVMRFGIGVGHELSATEIAQILGLSRASAYRKLQEALARLRRVMYDEAG
jgi:RNA polymerase sigma-70 factor (ECF subfamily)